MTQYHHGLMVLSSEYDVVWREVQKIKSQGSYSADDLAAAEEKQKLAGKNVFKYQRECGPPIVVIDTVSGRPLEDLW